MDIPVGEGRKSFMCHLKIRSYSLVSKLAHTPFVMVEFTTVLVCSAHIPMFLLLVPLEKASLTPHTGVTRQCSSVVALVNIP